MNTNSNSYTMIYASVMVIIVAFILAFTSSSLRDRQETNVKLDKMKQILAALHVHGDNAETLYKQHVLKDLIMDNTGAVKDSTGGFAINMATEMNKPANERSLPLYVCQVEGQRKYILPLTGAGLWGPIWGYICLNDDKNTVYGAFFSHAGETPGLGAEIASDHFQKEFDGKQVMKNYKVALGVEKFGKVTDPTTQVDGISGGTITSKGVDAMLKECLSQYTTFLTSKE